MNELTAAHATLPLPSYAKVSNLENGRSVVVRINDRGPFVGTRIIDMSRRSAEVLGFKPQGMAKVRVQYIGPAPLNDQGQHLAAMNRELRNGTPINQMMAAAEGRWGGERNAGCCCRPGLRGLSCGQNQHCIGERCLRHARLFRAGRLLRRSLQCRARP